MGTDLAVLNSLKLRFDCLGGRPTDLKKHEAEGMGGGALPNIEGDLLGHGAWKREPASGQ